MLGEIKNAVVAPRFPIASVGSQSSAVGVGGIAIFPFFPLSSKHYHDDRSISYTIVVAINSSYETT